MSSLDDAIKQARLLHRILIGVCAAIFAFALAPERSTRREQALRELGTLESVLPMVSEKDYLAWLRPELDEMASHDGFMDAVISGVRLAGCSVSESGLDPDVGLVVDWHATNYNVEAEAMGSEVGPNTDFNFLIRNLSLGGDPKVLVPSMTPAGITSEVESNIKAAITARGGNEGECTVASVRAESDHSEGGARRCWPCIRLFFEIAEWDPSEAATAHVSADEVPLEGRAFHDWFKGLAPDLFVVETDGREEFVPVLLEYMNEIRGMPFREIRRFLEEKPLPTNDELSFLGLTVDRAYAFIAAPLVLLGIFLYLLAHLSYILGALSGSEQRVEVRSAWQLLFPGRFNGMVVFVTLVVLPEGGIVILLSRLGGSGLQSPAALVISLLLFVTQAAALRLAMRLRRQVFCWQPGSGRCPKEGA